MADFTLPPPVVIQPSSSSKAMGELNRLAAKAKPNASQAAQTAKKFESALLSKVLQDMKDTMPESELFQSGVSGQFQDMFWMFLSQELSEKSTIGLAKQLTRQLEQVNQAVQPPTMEHKV